MDRSFMGNEALLQVSIDAQKELENQRQRTTFYMFFAGLAFTIMSFIGSHPVKVASYAMKIAEILALFAIMMSGILALFRLRGIIVSEPEEGWVEFYKNPSQYFYRLIFNNELIFWFLFIIGIILISINRAILAWRILAV